MSLSEPLDVVIVHRNQPARCTRTARAFLEQDVSVRITVVDNGSSPANCEALTTGLASIEGDVVFLGANRGFGPAANVGLRRWLDRGVGDWAAVAAHDALPAPGCLRRLLDGVTERPRAGLA